LIGRTRRAPLIAALLVLGCKPSTPSTTIDHSAAGTAAPGTVWIGGQRPARLQLPSGSDARPLVIALHGYGDRGERFLDALGYRELARRERLLVVAPDGTPDPGGLRFWNAGDACCNFHGSSVDDVAYLRGLIRELARRFPARLDLDRVYLIGLSNGGFMAYRLACEGVPLAAIVSIAGAGRRETDRCLPSRKLSLLQVHAPGDPTVLYGGGSDLLGLGGKAYPGARASVLRLARLQGCTPTLQPGGELDLVGPPAAETVVEHVPCPADRAIDLRLWTVRGAGHVPDFNPAFARESWRWLQALRRGR
jgi:polyhydroxybutyrate depolymerase